MSTITFDTLKYAERLKSAGIPEAHARAEAEALRDVLSETIDSSIVTKSILTTELAPIKADLARIDKKLVEHDGKFTLLHWMVGFNLAFTMAVLWKVFS